MAQTQDGDLEVTGSRSHYSLEPIRLHPPGHLGGERGKDRVTQALDIFVKGIAYVNTKNINSAVLQSWNIGCVSRSYLCVICEHNTVHRCELQSTRLTRGLFSVS